MNSNAFPYDVFLSHSAKDKPVVRPLAERLRQDGLKVPSAFGLRTSDFGFAQPGSFRFRYPLHQERRFIHWRLDDAPIKGSLAQFLYSNWLRTLSSDLSLVEPEQSRIMLRYCIPSTRPSYEILIS